MNVDVEHQHSPSSGGLFGGREPCTPLTNAVDPGSAIESEQRAVRHELIAARRTRRTDQLFARYGIGDHPEARQQRTTTIAHDTLTAPPAWVIDHLTQLHHNDRLPATRLDELATQVVRAATHLDQHGHLPHHWHNPQPTAIARALPAPDISLPGHGPM